MKAQFYRLLEQRASECRYFAIPLWRGNGYITMCDQVGTTLHLLWIRVRQPSRRKLKTDSLPLDSEFTSTSSTLPFLLKTHNQQKRSRARAFSTQETKTSSRRRSIMNLMTYVYNL